MSKYDTIYLDWDGVIWDFMQAFCDWNGVQVPDTNKWEFYEALSMTAGKFHEVLSELPQEFWQQEKYLMPHAHKLVEWAKANADNVFVLTVAPEWACWLGKQNLAGIHFGLTVYPVTKAEEKVEFAKDGALLIDDRPSSVVRFANEHSLASGLVWPAEYNAGLDEDWYFDVSQLEKADRLAGTIHDISLHDYSGKIKKPTVIRKSRIGVSAEELDRNFEKVCSNIAKGLGVSEAEKAEEPTVDSKPVLDYDAMDEAKKRKMTPMYSGLLAYFPDALALVARNSMVGHYQHNDPKDPMYWDRSKSADEMDAMIRHMADHSKNPRDKDGTLHMSKVAWRALAFVQKFIEEEQNEQG